MAVVEHQPGLGSLIVEAVLDEIVRAVRRLIEMHGALDYDDRSGGRWRLRADLAFRADDDL